MKGAVNQQNNNVTIEVKVKPGTDNTRIKGYNEWRENIKINASEPPEKGKANKEIISYLSNILDIENKEIEITKGHTQNQKTIKIQNAKQKQILNKLKKQLK